MQYNPVTNQQNGIGRVPLELMYFVLWRIQKTLT